MARNPFLGLLSFWVGYEREINGSPGHNTESVKKEKAFGPCLVIRLSCNLQVSSSTSKQWAASVNVRHTDREKNHHICIVSWKLLVRPSWRPWIAVARAELKSLRSLTISSNIWINLMFASQVWWILLLGAVTWWPRRWLNLTCFIMGTLLF